MHCLVRMIPMQTMTGKDLVLARGDFGNPHTSIIITWNKVANRWSI